ncbi:hypothetical protein PI125_g17215 [Phytophthora idaei]|nr:hypothetical protein PI125_g17215 [Phytophthora idaei]KAG3150858.1 hypothetical protein PI126_g11282 [Phytophthora idaei]
MGFAPRGMDSRVVEDAIQEGFDLAEPAPPRIIADAPTVMTSTYLRGLGSVNSALIPMVNPRTRLG